MRSGVHCPVLKWELVSRRGCAASQQKQDSGTRAAHKDVARHSDPAILLHKCARGAQQPFIWTCAEKRNGNLLISDA
jgi:hypothetical protein